MARHNSNLLTPRRALSASIAAALVLSVAPIRYTAWVGWFGDLATRLIAPISHPVLQLVRWVSPARVREDPPEQRLKLEDAARFQALYLRAARENAALRERVRDLQNGVALNPDPDVSLLTASVIGISTDLSRLLLRTRIGTEAGVQPRTVATVRGVQLLGRVVHAARGLSEIRPLTDDGADTVLGRVVLTEDGQGLLCTLEPDGAGNLRGAVEDPGQRPDLPAIEIEPGLLVRLDDDAWPRHAQMLELGRVTRVDRAEDQPLRRIITVRPAMDLSRVSDIELRITRALEGDG
ncbi:MAG: hypothetical protein H6811_11300 [Phycisphaeraceae bacterium]|nr:hypothetical protein [Phycisphaeraceae bacterium]